MSYGHRERGMSEARGVEVKGKVNMRRVAVSSIGWLDVSWLCGNDRVSRYSVVLTKDLLLIGRQFIGVAWKVHLPDNEIHVWVSRVSRRRMRKEGAA